MFSYYGSKLSIIHYYPAPVHGKIIEPFAGRGSYSLEYFDRDVLLVDKYEVIINIWKWLQKCSENDILSLPILKEGETLDSFNFDCEEAKNFMGFIVAFGMTKPRNKATSKQTQRPNFIRHRLKECAKQLFKIRHWKFKHGSYEDIENEIATWFIDPPYKNGGHIYVHGNKEIDFRHLGKWCIERLGQTIVCEETKADWLDFKPVGSNRAGRGDNSIEAIWTNFKTIYDNEQMTMF